MGSDKKINSALISVYHKDNLEEIIVKLHQLHVKLYATGGTQEFIEALNIPVIPVETVTEFPSILNGRVKTLHPRIFGGILGRRENLQDKKEMQEFNIPEIDLVIVDLYPFESTLASGVDDSAIIEKIDIGGISLIRAAAKNFNDVLIIPSATEYPFLLEIINHKNGISALSDRKKMAVMAFNVSSHYDTAIFNYYNNDVQLPVFKKSIQHPRHLRYGENPHQKANYFGDFNDLFEQLNGKEISYNNLLDIDAAISLLDEFSEPTFVIIKHNNACGIASDSRLSDAWAKALEGDPVSAFGGVLCSNRQVDDYIASEINKIFFEVLIAPSFDNAAIDILKQKKNRILLKQKKKIVSMKQYRSLLNGIAVQDKDNHTETAEDMIK